MNMKKSHSGADGKNALYVKFILIFIGGFFTVHTIILSFIANFNTGFAAVFILGIFFICHGIWLDGFRNSKGLLKWLKYAAYTGLSFMACLIIFIALYGISDTVNYNEDAVIVLGAGIKGENITSPLKYRLDKAVKYAEMNPGAVIVVSGGRGPQENITEALAMERYLRQKGITNILKEEKSTATFENFKYSKELLDGYFKSGYKAAFITNNFHIYRANYLARAAGIECARLHAGLSGYSMPANFIRESFAVLFAWVFGK
jgi:uncharacterized SAM-binding protein YcdF (DUF218 family)